MPTSSSPAAAPDQVPVLAVLCDLGPAYGVGHLMRCVALAEEFAARGHRVCFVADALSVPLALEQLDVRGFAHVPPPADPSGYAEVLDRIGAAAVVIDSYRLPREVYVDLADRFPTLALVDGDPEGRTAQVLLDQNIGAEDDVWTLAPGTERLAGLSYALMREEILSRRPATPERAEGDPPHVFAVIGGTDAFGAGPLLARALVATGRPFTLTVVAPSPWQSPVELGPGQSIELIEPTTSLADHVLAADLVISAAGTLTWELFCLGAACALVFVAENQRAAYERIVEQGLVAGLGSLDELREDPEGAVATLREVLTDAERRRVLRSRAFALVDGRGRQRVVDALEGLLG